jgi:hypothetical protein
LLNVIFNGRCWVKTFVFDENLMFCVWWKLYINQPLNHHTTTHQSIIKIKQVDRYIHQNVKFVHKMINNIELWRRRVLWLAHRILLWPSVLSLSLRIQLWHHGSRHAWGDYASLSSQPVSDVYQPSMHSMHLPHQMNRLGHELACRRDLSDNRYLHRLSQLLSSHLCIFGQGMVVCIVFHNYYPATLVYFARGWLCVSSFTTII